MFLITGFQNLIQLALYLNMMALPFSRLAAVAVVSCLFIPLKTSAQIKPILPKGSTRALVVGISTYQHITPLQFAHRDAEAFAEFLRSPAGGSVPETQLKLLTNEKATSAQIESALSWLMSESQPGDQAIIYFSGHGDVETKVSDNSGFLLACNAGKSNYSAGGAVPMKYLQEVIDTLSVEKQVRVLLIADACRSGNLAGAETGGANTTALAMSKQFANEIKIMSCQPNEVSLESQEWGGGHSVFSYYLLDGLRGLADDGDGSVTLLEIGHFLQDSVRRATAARRRQTPMTLGDADRVVAKVDAATLAAIRQKNSPLRTNPSVAATSPSPTAAPVSHDSLVQQLYGQFETALRTRHLLLPEKDAAYAIYQQIKDQAAMRSYKNSMRNDLAAALQDEAQKAINDYLSADPREMRRRWSLDDSRYRLYPQYLEKAAELLGEKHFSYAQIKAREHYFSGLNLRLQGERPGNAAIKDSLFRAAQALQEKTLALDSTAAYAYNELGVLARRFEHYEQSIVYFNKALRFSPTWVLPWANLCGSYNEIGDTAKAERYGLKALALDSTFALSHYNLGYVYMTKKEDAKASEHFLKTIAYQPDYTNAYYNLGAAYYNNGKYLQAAQMWEEYDRRNPNDPSVLQSLGEVGINLGKGVNYSESLFIRAIALDSTYAKAYFALGTLYLTQNEYSKSEKYLKAFLILKPDDAEAYYQMAIAQHQGTKEALQSLDKALQMGFKDYSRLKNEIKFAQLRKQPGYKNLVKQYFPGKT